MSGAARLVFQEIRFAHSLFALPFALVGLLLAAGGMPGVRVFALVVLAVVAARSAAMGFNRIVDRHLDRRNPRTARRALARGALSPTVMGVFVTSSAFVFLLAAWALNALALRLAPLVLLVLLGYSYTKRFTALSHFVLGLSLGLAPPASWVAVRGTLDPSMGGTLLLGLAVMLWVAGFDLLYACQDVEADRRLGLRSIPSRLGIPAALRLSRALHAGMVLALVGVGIASGRGWVYHAGLVPIAALLLWEHSLLRPDDLSRLNTAFFTANGLVSVLFLVTTSVDLLA